MIVGIVIACLMWAVGVVLLIGLPKYYRQAPGHIPSFYTSLFRRKIILVRHTSTSPTNQPHMANAMYLTVVLRRSNNPKLLALRPLRPQLALPLVEHPYLRLANRPPRRPLLHRRLGRLPIRLRRPIHQPLQGLDPLHNGTRRPPLGTDALGHFQHRGIRPLGGRTRHIRHRWPQLMALAWCPRRSTRCRLRHDSPANTNAIPRPLHINRRASSWIYSYDLSKSDGAG